MTLLEGTVFFLLLLLALPGLCRRIHRPGLLYPAYILAGAAAGMLMEENVISAWRQIGQLGFILLLFSVGLEIELPEKKESLVALRRALAWIAPQVALIVAVFVYLKISPLEGFVSALALSSTSVGMAFVLWRNHPFSDSATGKAFLEWLVAIEIVSILFLALETPILQGAVWWLALLRFVGLLAAVGLAAFVSLRFSPRFAQAVGKGLKIEVPLLVLLLFGICAIGDRLGLSAPKTAFVLGLFISRSTDEEAAFSRRLEPLRDRMFVPVFFFGIGTLIGLDALCGWQFYAALAAGVGLYLFRRALFGAFFARMLGTDVSAHAMAAPVLTIVAVAVEVLSHAKASPQLAVWTLASGLSLTLCASFAARAKNHMLVEYETATVAPEASSVLEGASEAGSEGGDRASPKGGST